MGKRLFIDSQSFPINLNGVTIDRSYRAFTKRPELEQP
jgi:hypothetical protein